MHFALLYVPCYGGMSFLGINDPKENPDCHDLTFTNGTQWHNSLDQQATCDWYARDERSCLDFGWDYRNEHTANEACCVCQGGQKPHRDGNVVGVDASEDVFKEGIARCHAHCNEVCRNETLCSEPHMEEPPVWIDPQWKNNWYCTKFIQILSKIALGDSYHYPSASVAARSNSSPLLWLNPCTSGVDCDVGPEYKKTNISRPLAHFSKWYDSPQELFGRGNFTPYKSVAVGGKRMCEEDMEDTATGRKRCVKRCDIWCRMACECNWAWDFAWAHSHDMGWKYRRPLRFRWVIAGKSGSGTWRCVNGNGNKLLQPWDSPSWSLDVYSDAVKREVNTGSFAFHLTCDHVKRYFAREVCGQNLVGCALNCSTAATMVVRYCKKNKMLKYEYMQSKARRTELRKELHQGIQENCRRTCAEAHKPDFREHYPE